MNNRIHVSFSILVSSVNMPRKGIAGSYGGFIPSFLGISIPSSRVAVSIYIPINSARGTLFSTPSPAIIVCRFFDEGHSDRCEVISHCSFNLYFSNNYWCWTSFHVFVRHLYVFFGEISIYVFCPFFYCIFFILRYMNCFYILEINTLAVASFANILLHSEGCLLVLSMVFFAVQKLLSLIRSNLLIFIFITLGGGSEETLLQFIFCFFPVLPFSGPMNCTKF